jgi:hypothetical protein
MSVKTLQDLESDIRQALVRLGVQRRPVQVPVVPPDVNVVDSRDAKEKA